MHMRGLSQGACPRPRPIGAGKRIREVPDGSWSRLWYQGAARFTKDRGRHAALPPSFVVGEGLGKGSGLWTGA